MKKYSTLLTTLLFSLAVSLPISQSVFAAQTKVEWVNPKSYADMRAGEQNRKAFRERTLKVLEQHLIGLAQHLPQEQTLFIKVLNLDLAGEIDFVGARQLRILKQPYFPRATISFQLVDSHNKVLTSGEDKLKNSNFLQVNHLSYRNKPLGHEKKMLDDWFKQRFAQWLANH